MKFQFPKLPEILLLLLLLGCSLLVWTALLDISFLPRFSFLFLMLLVINGYFFSIKASVSQINPTTLIYASFILLASFVTVNALNPAESIFGITKLLSGFLTYFILLHLFGNTPTLKDNISRSAPFLFLGVIIVNSLVIAAQISDKGMFSMKEKDLLDLSGLMSNKNLGAEFFSMLIPFFAFYKAQSKMETLLKWGMPLLIILFSIVMQARGAFLAAIAGCAICFVFEWKSNAGKLVVFRNLAIAVVIVGISFLVIDYFSSNQVSKLFAEIFKPKLGTGNTRLNNWFIGLKQIQEHPFLGLGLENWKIDFPKYGYKQAAKTFASHPLNDFISIATETGLFGLMLFIALLLFPLYHFITAKSEHVSPLEKIAFTLLIIYGVVACFNFPKDRMEHFLMFNFCLAVLSPFKISNTKWNSQVFIMFGLLISGGLYIAQQRISAEYNLAKALKYRQQNNWGKVIKYIDKAENPYYSLDISTSPVVWYRGVAAFTLGNSSQARLDFETAYRQHPNHTQVMSNQAAMLELDGKHTDAETLYKNLIKMSPIFWEAYENYAILLYNQKRYEEALRLLIPYKRKGKARRYQMIRYNLSAAYWNSLSQESGKLKQEGKTAEAKQIDKKLQELLPQYAIVYEKYARLLFKEGRYSDAYSVAFQSPDKQSIEREKILVFTARAVKREARLIKK